MDQEWHEYIADNCDVVVSLVRRSTSITTASASADQGSAVMDEDEARNRERLSNPEEEEQNLGDLHVNSGQLRRCSKYFDTCLSERWARTEIRPSKTPVHLTLDVYTDVEYYRDCFSRMCSSKHARIPNVNHCLKLLQVASQISYLDLVEDCVRYLTSVPWSREDEKRIRQFANSAIYPSDCAADLSARLGLALNNTERHVLLLDVTKHTLCESFDNAMRYHFYAGGLPTNCQEIFSSGFWVVIAGQCPTLAENVLKHVTDCVKRVILEAKEHPQFHEDQGLCSVHWALTLLLETGSAVGLVEYIVDESPLCEILQNFSVSLQQGWVDLIHSVFQEVLDGRLLLKTSTRYFLLKKWTWVLLRVGCNGVEALHKSRIRMTLSTFIKTFPDETQKEIFSDWLGFSLIVHEDFFSRIYEDWIASLQEKLIS